jgi:hypothetical protein
MAQLRGLGGGGGMAVVGRWRHATIGDLVASPAILRHLIQRSQKQQVACIASARPRSCGTHPAGACVGLIHALRTRRARCGACRRPGPRAHLAPRARCPRTRAAQAPAPRTAEGAPSLLASPPTRALPCLSAPAPRRAVGVGCEPGERTAPNGIWDEILAPRQLCTAPAGPQQPSPIGSSLDRRPFHEQARHYGGGIRRQRWRPILEAPDRRAVRARRG